MVRRSGMGLITMTLTVIAALAAAPFRIVANEDQVWVATWSTAPVEPNSARAVVIVEWVRWIPVNRETGMAIRDGVVMATVSSGPSGARSW